MGVCKDNKRTPEGGTKQLIDTHRAQSSHCRAHLFKKSESVSLMLKQQQLLVDLKTILKLFISLIQNSECYQQLSLNHFVVWVFLLNSAASEPRYLHVSSSNMLQSHLFSDKHREANWAQVTQENICKSPTHQELWQGFRALSATLIWTGELLTVRRQLWPLHHQTAQLACFIHFISFLFIWNLRLRHVWSTVINRNKLIIMSSFVRIQYNSCCLKV